MLHILCIRNDVLIFKSLVTVSFSTETVRVTGVRGHFGPPGTPLTPTVSALEAYCDKTLSKVRHRDHVTFGQSSVWRDKCTKVQYYVLCQVFDISTPFWPKAKNDPIPLHQAKMAQKWPQNFLRFFTLLPWKSAKSGENHEIWHLPDFMGKYR